MESVQKKMDAISHAMADDGKMGMMFGLSLVGSILCGVGIAYTPQRIFFEDKMSGVSLPCFSVVLSVVVGVLVLVASGSRSRFMLKYIGGAPNSMAICLLLFTAYALNIWTIEHRQDKGFATGILDDSQTAFHFYVAGAAFCIFAHFFYLWNIPTRV